MKRFKVQIVSNDIDKAFETDDESEALNRYNVLKRLAYQLPDSQVFGAAVRLFDNGFCIMELAANASTSSSRT